MKLDTSGVDLQALARFVGERYGLEPGNLAFLPKGEASYAYLTDGAAGARWLVKLQAMARTAGLEARLQAVRYLFAERGFTQVVAPLENRAGGCTSPFGPYTLTVYPFVEGECIEPDRQTAEYASGLAALLAGFHQQGEGLPVTLPKAAMDNPSEAAVLRALQAVEARGRLANPMQERLRAHLLTHRANIETSLENMRQIAAAVGELALDGVLTHRDPNWANILVDAAGVFRLLDFEEIAIGPPEADLVFFSDRPPERFEFFLRQYLAVRPEARLHTELFAYGHYRWSMHEIADYTSRILFEDSVPAEAEHAWTELQPYIPAPHAEMAASIRQVDEVLARIYGPAFSRWAPPD